MHLRNQEATMQGDQNQEAGNSLRKSLLASYLLTYRCLEGTKTLSFLFQIGFKIDPRAFVS
jgi:hypothetical protein